MRAVSKSVSDLHSALDGSHSEIGFTLQEILSAVQDNNNLIRSTGGPTRDGGVNQIHCLHSSIVYFAALSLMHTTDLQYESVTPYARGLQVKSVRTGLT